MLTLSSSKLTITNSQVLPTWNLTGKHQQFISVVLMGCQHLGCHANSPVKMQVFDIVACWLGLGQKMLTQLKKRQVTRINFLR